MMRRLAVFAAVTTTTVACSMLVNLDNLGVAKDAATIDDGVIDMGSEHPFLDGGRCPLGRGPAMVAITSVAGEYCVDSTEVTQAQYKAFLDENVALASQTAVCASINTTFTPSSTALCATVPFDPVGHGNYPVVCVDWCDATAFCSWAGKRLCGRVGPDAGPSDFNGNSVYSQWYAACSHATQNLYPYGPTYDASACNGLDRDAGATDPVASLASCVGGYPGIFDMSGNVSELENSCSEDAGDAGVCYFRGGGWTELQTQLTCQFSDTFRRTDVGTSVGFRCCAD